MADRQRLIDTLVDLIRIDSPSGEEDAIDAAVSARLAALGLAVEHDAYGNIVARLEGAGEPLLLSAHLDTVEPGRGIKPQLDGDTLRSDGTTILGGDCKAGLAIVLEALACVAESGGPRRAVEVAFSRHEEGGLVGVRHMDFSLLTAKTGIVFDGEGPPNRITVSAPSQNVVTAEIVGRAAHAGLEPESGLSALLVTADILTRLPLGRIDAETTANIGWMEGGLKRNIVPERAALDGEFRSRSNEKLAWLEGQFRKVFDETAARYPNARISLDITNTYQAYRIGPDNSAVVTIGNALGKLGLSPVMEASGGGSDANVFNQRGITALPVGIGVRSFHTTWETAEIPEVLQGAEMCRAAIMSVR